MAPSCLEEGEVPSCLVAVVVLLEVREGAVVRLLEVVVGLAYWEEVVGVVHLREVLVVVGALAVVDHRLLRQVGEVALVGVVGRHQRMQLEPGLLWLGPNPREVS